MAGPEYEHPLPETAVAFIEMARLFTGKKYPVNRQGFNEATDDMRRQHEKTLPAIPTQGILIRLVSQIHPVVEASEKFANMAIDMDDYEAALVAANHLYAYGETDRRYFLGGKVFGWSVNTHRILAARIRDKYSNDDPYLRHSGRRLHEDIERLRNAGKFPEELGLLRALIHTATLNGTLGDAARKYFDPFAIVAIDSHS